MSAETTPAGSTRPRREEWVVRVGEDVDEAVRKELAFVLRSTGAKPQTEAEIRTKLRRREVDDDVIDSVLERARQLRALDDAAFARAWVEERGLRRGYGLARIREELRRREVPEALIEDALVLLEDRDDLAAATEVAQQRLASLPASLQPDAVARRLAGYLGRRGYPAGLAQRVAIEVSGLNRSWD